MNISRVNPGDLVVPKASTFNAFADAANAHRSQNANTAPTGSTKPWLIDVHNAGTVNLSMFDAVELGDPILSDAQNEIEFDRLAGFNVTRPTDPAQPGKMAILQEPIGPGRVGRAMIFGVTPARLIIVDSEDHDRARFGTDGELVSSDDGPAVILWKSPQAQENRRAIVALVQTGSVAKRWARVTGATLITARRWQYAMEFVRVGVSGDWDADGGTVVALNTIEAANASTGIQGNGVNADTLPDGFDVVPFAIGAVMRVSGPHGVDGLWFFTAANLVDGACG